MVSVKRSCMHATEIQWYIVVCYDKLSVHATMCMYLGPDLVIISFSSSLSNYYDAGGRALPLGHYLYTNV